MSREEVASALDRAAEALAEAAHALRASDTPSSEAASAAAAFPPPAAAARLPQRPQLDDSAFTECPAHRQPFKEGKFGKFCSGTGEPDGNWYNDKGYCRVTPKSAGTWLKQHPSAA